MTVSVTLTAETPADLHAQMLALIGHARDIPGVKSNTTILPAESTPATEIGSGSVGATGVAEEVQPTAEVVPINERKKPGRPKKAETVVDAEPAKNPEPTVEDARAVLKDIQTKIGNEEARQLNKKHGEEPLSEKKPAQWAAIIAEGKTLLAALDAE